MLDKYKFVQEKEKLRDSEVEKTLLKLISNKCF